MLLFFCHLISNSGQEPMCWGDRLLPGVVQHKAACKAQIGFKPFFNCFNRFCLLSNVMHAFFVWSPILFTPVPYVFLASPLLTQPWPRSAALGTCEQDAIFTSKGNFCLPAGLLQLPRCQDPSKGRWLDFQSWRRTPDQDYFEVILTEYILLPINSARFAHIIIRSHAYCSRTMFKSFCHQVQRALIPKKPRESCL